MGSWFENLVQAANPIAYASNNALTNGELDRQVKRVGGTNQEQPSSVSGSNPAARQADIDAGIKKGHEIFYDDPDMQALRNRREDLAKGYNGQELGAMKGQAESELQGNRSGYLRQLSSKLARNGVGGARAAAMGASADQGFNKNAADMDRKMTLDNANMVRNGTDDLQKFIFNQKYGTLGTGMSYGQMGVADRSADAQAALANQKKDPGLFGNFVNPFFGGG
jgi:hypothetical protein